MARSGGGGLTLAGCTIVSPNYGLYARTLAASYLAQHPEQRFFVLIVADLDDATPFAGEPFTPVLLKAIGLRDLRAEAMKYDILELNTNVKPTFLKHLLSTYELDAITYLDPDIFVYAPLTPVWQALQNGASAVLTPHITTPVFDGRSPSEQDHLYNGTFNLGFVAVRHSDEGLRLLDRWEERCLELGFSEGRTGLFVDQKWMNLAPVLFRGVSTLLDAGCNMAYWNLHERALVEKAGGYEVQSTVSGASPLRFFHYSGLVLDDPENLSRNTDRYTLADRPDLQMLFAAYRRVVQANRKLATDSLPYGFGTLSDGTTVTRLARRLYAMHIHHFDGSDPFDATGPFASFTRKYKLVAGAVTPPKSTWREFNPRDRRVAAVHKLLRLTLRALGPHRYELLMRYLAHIAVLRNQSVFLREKAWHDEAE